MSTVPYQHTHSADIQSYIPDGVDAGQQDVQPQVKLGLVDEQGLSEVTLDTVRSFGELTWEINCS